jgi:hypothetical protein
MIDKEMEIVRLRSKIISLEDRNNRLRLELRRAKEKYLKKHQLLTLANHDLTVALDEEKYHRIKQEALIDLLYDKTFKGVENSKITA